MSHTVVFSSLQYHHSNAGWPQSTISFYITLVFFSITFKEMLKHPHLKAVYSASIRFKLFLIRLLCTVYPTALHCEPCRAMKSSIIQSISSSVRVLKRVKCSRSIKRTWRILISHVKPGLCKSSSTSGGIPIYLGVHSLLFDKGHLLLAIALIYCFQTVDKLFPK